MLKTLSERVRTLRTTRSWSREALAERSGVSVRFIADLERGAANISVLRLAEIAAALECSLVTLLAGTGPVEDAGEVLAGLSGEARRRALRMALAPVKIALVGLRGAGKSTVGRALATALEVPFVEVDQAVEEAAGLRLGEIFEYHGATRYRELEKRALERLLAEPGGAVLATGGSVVTAPDTWEMLRRASRTVWLRASPENHLARVEAQGDFRPMRGREDALAELKQILAARERLYGQAERVVDTEMAGVAEAVEGIVGWVR